MKSQKNENPFQKNDYMMSDLNDLSFFQLKPFKEDFRDDRTIGPSNMTCLYQSKYFRKDDYKDYKESVNISDSESEKTPDIQSIQTLSFKNVKNNQENDDLSQSLIYITDFDNDSHDDNIDEEQKENEISIRSDNENDNENENENNCSFKINSAFSFSISYDLDKGENNYSNIFNTTKREKIFRIVKVTRFRDLPQKKRRGRGKYKSKKNDIDWENIITPKEKHFHLDRKKKRIVFQRKHLKMIYSIANLQYPFNFTELYKLIDEHVGDKTVYNYGNKKSYHIIRIDGKPIITTMKEKKTLLGKKVKNK